MHKEISPYKRVAYVLQKEDYPYYTGWRVAKSDGVNKKTCYCALGILAKNKGMPDWLLRIGWRGNVLLNYGFSPDELEVRILCPVNGCRKAATLEDLIAHFNMDHKFLPREIAYYLEILENSKVVMQSRAKRLFRCLDKTLFRKSSMTVTALQ